MIYAISIHNPKRGLKVESDSEFLMLMMYDAYSKGISPAEFRKTRVSDLSDIAELKNAFEHKNMREAEVRKLIAKMRR